MFRLSVCSLCCLWFLGGPSAQAGGLYPQSREAYKKRVKSINYVKFFSEEQNFYLANPKLIKAIFFGLVELKGNHRVARRHIQLEVLGCPDQVQLRSRCIVDRYYHKKRRLKIPSRFDFAVNFTRIKRIRRPGRRDRLALSWRQNTLAAPVVEVSDFLEMIGAASESKYYKVKTEIKQIVFNAQFENHFEVVLPDRLMADLVSLYSPIPQDSMDRIYYKIVGVDLSINKNLGSANLRLKAEKVLINHRLLAATAEPIRVTQ